MLMITFPFSLPAKEIDVDSEILGVRHYMNNFSKYSSQTVQIEGIVSKIYKKRNIIGLIDIQELKECKVVTCAQLTLPIRWNGEMPQIRNRISIIGKAKKEQNGFIFIADSLIINELNQIVK